MTDPRMLGAWTILLAAGLLEIVWALCIKRSDGCRHPGWTTAGILIAIVSIVILAQAMRRLPASTSYAVWAGVGAAGTALVAILLCREPVSVLKISSLLLIIAGIIGLRLGEGRGNQMPSEPSQQRSER